MDPVAVYAKLYDRAWKAIVVYNDIARNNGSDSTASLIGLNRISEETLTALVIEGGDLYEVVIPMEGDIYDVVSSDRLIWKMQGIFQRVFQTL